MLKGTGIRCPRWPTVCYMTERHGEEAGVSVGRVRVVAAASCFARGRRALLRRWRAARAGYALNSASLGRQAERQRRDEYCADVRPCHACIYDRSGSHRMVERYSC